jgi:hypothetical protein
VYGGAEGTTCHDVTFFHDYKLLTRDKYFNDAGNKTHRSVGEGYLRGAVCIKGQTTPSHFMVHSYHMPTIPITVLSPGRTMLRHSSRFDVHTVYMNHVSRRGYAKFHGIGPITDVEVPGIVRGVLMYAQAYRPAIIAYVAYVARPINAIPVSPDDVADAVNYIPVAAERVLWHQRIGHVNPRKLADLHKYVKSIPKITMPSDV